MGRRILAWCLTLLVIPGSAGATSTAEAWGLRLKELDGLLREGRWQESLEEAGELTDQMLKKLGTSPGAHYLLAVATADRALAEAGLGMLEEADWHWHVAQALDLSIAAADLLPFGEAGERIKQGVPSGGPPLLPTSSNPEADLEVTKPRCEQRRPQFPLNLLLRGTGSRVVARVIIGRDGRPRRPELVRRPPGPVEAFTALESLRQWRCEPATQGGQPVPVYYTLTVDFMR